MTGRYLLAIDAGTGSCRAVLFTETGEQVAVGQREWVHREPPGVPGGQDFDVTAGWRAMGECVRDALRGAGATGADVAAVAATSMREGMVLFDRAGREIWACPNVDSRAAAEAEDLIREGAAAKIYAEAGDWVSITAPARLRWLARHEPGILAATGRLGMLSDWIVYRLCGQHVTEPSCGSSSGMFTLADRRWSPSITALCGLPAAVLPPVVDPGTVVGEVSAAAAEATGLRAGTAGGGGRRRHPARPARGRRRTRRVHRGGRHVLAEHGAARRAAHRPGGPAAHAVPRQPGRVDAGGHRLLLRHEHAVVPRRVLRAEVGAGPQPGRRTRTS